jgi:hypothetical protein
METESVQTYGRVHISRQSRLSARARIDPTQIRPSIFGDLAVIFSDYLERSGQAGCGEAL